MIGIYFTIDCVDSIMVYRLGFLAAAMLGDPCVARILLIYYLSVRQVLSLDLIYFSEKQPYNHLALKMEIQRLPITA